MREYLTRGLVMKMKKIIEETPIKLSRFQILLNKIKEKKEKKKQEKQETRNADIKYKTRISELKETTKIHLNELVSDLRLFRPKFWNRVKAKIFGSSICLCVIHYTGNADVIRYYPMPKPFVVDINKTLYLFSPKAFRYINGIPKLEFYANIPFAIVHNIGDTYIPPSLDAEAFTSVQNSKHIQDACKIDKDESPNIWFIIILVLVIICIMAVAFDIFNVMKIMKAMNIK